MMYLIPGWQARFSPLRMEIWMSRGALIARRERVLTLHEDDEPENLVSVFNDLQDFEADGETRVISAMPRIDRWATAEWKGR